MHQFIYTSRAVVPLDEEELDALLEGARRFNAEHGLTGMLLYYRDDALENGAFMQYLEGPEEAVGRVMRERIEPDRRHRGIEVFVDEPRDGRLFDGWYMGFPVTSTRRPPEGFIELMDVDLEPTVREELAMRLLRKFREAALDADGRLQPEPGPAPPSSAA